MMAGGAIGVGAVIALIVAMVVFPLGSAVSIDPSHVAVAVFCNVTGDPSLDHVGERATHWTTQGLQHAAIHVTPWDGAWLIDAEHCRPSRHSQQGVVSGREWVALLRSLHDAPDLRRSGGGSRRK